MSLISQAVCLALLQLRCWVSLLLQPRAHSLLCLHIQTPYDPQKNVLTGIYQIPALSVPFSVLTLGFWDFWFPKRPLTVKLNKGWGRDAGQELLLSLHQSILVLQPGWHPLPCAGDPLERLQPSVLQHPITCGQCQPFQSCQSRLSHTSFSPLSLTILGPLTHSHKGQIWHKPPTKGLDQNETSFCCQCGGWEGCPQPRALQEHKMSDFNQHQALAVIRMLACTLKSLNSSAFGVLCCQGQLLSLCIVLLCDPTHKWFLPIPQWIADRNEPNFISLWRAYAQWLLAHRGSGISQAVHQQPSESSCSIIHSNSTLQTAVGN